MGDIAAFQRTNYQGNPAQLRTLNIRDELSWIQLERVLTKLKCLSSPFNCRLLNTRK